MKKNIYSHIYSQCTHWWASSPVRAWRDCGPSDSLDVHPRITHRRSGECSQTGWECKVSSFEDFPWTRFPRIPCTNLKPVDGLSELHKPLSPVSLHLYHLLNARSRHVTDNFRHRRRVRACQACRANCSPRSLRPRCNAHLVDYGSLGFAIQPTRFDASLAKCYSNYV